MLQNKNAVIYGAAGSLGGAVAKALAGAGAQVFLTGRNTESIQKIAQEILQLGGKASVAKVDAMDEKAIAEHLETLVQQTGAVDISFNAVGIPIVMNKPRLEITADDYLGPITYMMRSQFLTMTAAARQMVNQKSGVIPTLTATPGGIGYPFTGGFAPACCAIENFSKNLAMELGIYGVRVVNMRSGGSPDSKIFKEALENNPEPMNEILRQMEADTMLKRLPLMKDIGNLSVFLSSNMAVSITGVTVDISCGTTAGLNYRVTSLPS